MEKEKHILVHIIDPLGCSKKNGITDMDDLYQELETSVADSFCRAEKWIVGKDISLELVEKWMDFETKDIYTVVTYENGKPYAHFLSKLDWEKLKTKLD